MEKIDHIIIKVEWKGMDKNLKGYLKLKITTGNGVKHTILTQEPWRFSVCKDLDKVLEGLE